MELVIAKIARCHHPRQLGRIDNCPRLQAQLSLCWPVSGLTVLPASPSRVRVQNTQWLIDEDWTVKSSQSGPFDRCGGSAGKVPDKSGTLLLPVELRHVNHTASTNNLHFMQKNDFKPYNSPMVQQVQIEQICERVERLLLRHAELQRTNSLLAAQVEALTQERDSFKSRLAAARARVDTLLERLPQPSSHGRAPDSTLSSRP